MTFPSIPYVTDDRGICPRTWAESDKAKRLLAAIDAVERSSDRYAGLGWSAVAEAFTRQASDLQCELDNLRARAVEVFADAASDDRDSNAWYEAFEEADSEAESVEDAIARARRLHMGDGLLERAAA